LLSLPSAQPRVLRKDSGYQRIFCLAMMDSLSNDLGGTHTGVFTMIDPCDATNTSSDTNALFSRDLEWYDIFFRPRLLNRAFALGHTQHPCRSRSHLIGLSISTHHAVSPPSLTINSKAALPYRGLVIFDRQKTSNLRVVAGRPLHPWERALWNRNQSRLPHPRPCAATGPTAPRYQ